MTDFFPTVAVHALVGAALPVIGYLAQKAYDWYRSRSLRGFWQPFAKNACTLIFTQYRADSNERLTEVADITGGHYLLSEGMALAMSRMLEFCNDYVTKRKNMLVVGDKAAQKHTDNIILLGSPAVNLFSRKLYEHLSEMYEMPYRIVWENNQVRFIDLGHEKVGYKVKDELGDDYALVIKCVYQSVPPKHLLMLCGCHMQGTQAAAEAVTDTRILDVVVRETNSSENLAFVVRTKIINNSPSGPELQVNGRQYISSLTLKSLDVAREQKPEQLLSDEDRADNLQIK